MRLAALCALAFAALAALAPAERSPRMPREPWLRGMNLTSYTLDGLSAPAADRALERLAASGTRWVAIVLPFRTAGRTASTIETDGRTPSDAAVEHAAAKARALGLQVWLKPHVNPDDGTFRGDLAPDDRDGWWAAYTALVTRTADLAARVGADGLVVGTELTSLAQDEDRWRGLIAEVRRRLPAATLTWAANWVDGAEAVRFWDALDLVGVDAYMPLAPGGPPDPDVAALVTAWQGHVARLEALAARTGRPVVFTELGYESRSGSTRAPAQPAAGAVDEGLQARAYEAVYRVFAGRPWFRGVFWWDWSAEELGDPGSYHPHGKQAEAVLRRFNAGALDLRGSR